MAAGGEGDRGRYHFDRAAQALRRSGEVVALRPKALAILVHLATRRGHLVSKRAILDAIWPGVSVTESSLTGCINELRAALGDSREQANFIETVHGSGYRFIGTIAGLTEPDQPQQNIPNPPASVIFGRDEELARLRRHFSSAAAGQRQFVIVGGEAGIGKTTVVERFVEEVENRPDVMVARSQCFRAHSGPDPFLPLLEAFGALCRGPHRDEVVATMLAHAPLWLAQLSLDLSDDESAALRAKLGDPASTRMLREMATLLEEIGSHYTFVMLLDDMHWGDRATLDVLALLARRRHPARLMIVITYRPVDAIVHQHPLPSFTQDLLSQRLCSLELLGFLSSDAIEAYVAQRFASPELTAEFAGLLLRHSEGHPMFMVSLIEHLIACGWLLQDGGRWRLTAAIDRIDLAVPDSLRRLIETQIDSLPASEREVLQAAAVVGIRFATDAVAAGIAELPAQELDEVFARLARRNQFVRSLGTEQWPDGTVSGRYEFRHSWYHDVALGQVTPSRLRQLCQRIGERLERAYGNRATELASTLSLHFERAGDAERTINYLRVAADNAVRCHAHREAVPYLHRLLALLDTLPDDDQRAQQEVDALLSLCMAKSSALGGVTGEIDDILARAHRLGQSLNAVPQVCMALFALQFMHMTRGEFTLARDLSNELMQQAQSLGFPALTILGHFALGSIACGEGKLEQARGELEAAEAVFGSEFPLPVDLQILVGGVQVITLSRLGYGDQAHEIALRMQQRALTVGGSSNHIAACVGNAILLSYERNFRETCVWADRALAVSDAGYEAFRASASILKGWGLANLGSPVAGLVNIDEGFETDRIFGTRMGASVYLAYRAEVLKLLGRHQEALDILAEARNYIEVTGGSPHESEVLRLEGEILLAVPRPAASHSVEADAAACFERAIASAQRCGARQLELRALLRLVELQRHEGQPPKAAARLRDVHSWFSEGFGAADMVAAARVIQELSGGSHPVARS